MTCNGAGKVKPWIRRPWHWRLNRRQVVTQRVQSGPLSDFLNFASGFWMGRAARSAVLLAAAILLLLFANLVVNIGLNRWQRWFFDTLERRDTAFLPLALTAIAALVLIGAGLAVAMVTCRMTLQVNWRRWLTEALMAIWLDRNRLGAQGITGENHGSPAFRVAEDVRLAIDPIVDLVIGFLNASILAITFVGILVIVGGSFPLVIGGTSTAVPAYIAIAALVHAAAVSGITLLVGCRDAPCGAEPGGQGVGDPRGGHGAHGSCQHRARARDRCVWARQAQ